MTPDPLIADLRAKMEAATAAPWNLCRHLESEDADKACSCGYRGVIFGPEHDVAYAVFQPGHDLPLRQEEWGSEPARYPRQVEIANAQLAVAMRNHLPALLDRIERAEKALVWIAETPRETFSGPHQHGEWCRQIARDAAAIRALKGEGDHIAKAGKAIDIDA